MDREIDIAELISSWLEVNSKRLSRFEVERVSDWSRAKKQGLAIDLVHSRVIGRVTAWPKHLTNADRPFADAEGLDAETGDKLFYWAFEPLSVELLDNWLSLLERYADSEPGQRNWLEESAS
jgi:hypothetical protein